MSRRLRQSHRTITGLLNATRSLNTWHGNEPTPIVDQIEEDECFSDLVRTEITEPEWVKTYERVENPRRHRNGFTIIARCNEGFVFELENEERVGPLKNIYPPLTENMRRRDVESGY